MEAMALIEIDGLPINSMVIFHGYVSHNQMVNGGFSGMFFKPRPPWQMTTDCPGAQLELREWWRVPGPWKLWFRFEIWKYTDNIPGTFIYIYGIYIYMAYIYIWFMIIDLLLVEWGGWSSAIIQAGPWNLWIFFWIRMAIATEAAQRCWCLPSGKLT